MLEPFKGADRCVTMDSAYMGDIMAQVGCDEWKMNMVDTSMDNQTGAGPEAKEKKQTLKKDTCTARKKENSTVTYFNALTQSFLGLLIT